MNDKTQFVSIEEAAKILRVTIIGVRELIREGKLSATECGETFVMLIPKAEVERLAYRPPGRPRSER